MIGVHSIRAPSPVVHWENNSGLLGFLAAIQRSLSRDHQRGREEAAMYIEETDGGNGDIKVAVGGEEYTAEANYDVDSDGVDDAAAVLTDEGFVAFSDDDADGAADLKRTLDPDGEVLESALSDSRASGAAVGEPGAPSVVVHDSQGVHPVGAPTEDSNNDGRPDTAVINEEQRTLLVTDENADGSADHIVEISGLGEVAVARPTEDGEWHVLERKGIDGTPISVGTDDKTWTFDETQHDSVAAGTPDVTQGSSPSWGYSLGQQLGSGFGAAADSVFVFTDGRTDDAAWS